MDSSMQAQTTSCLKIKLLSLSVSTPGPSLKERKAQPGSVGVLIPLGIGFNLWETGTSGWKPLTRHRNSSGRCSISFSGSLIRIKPLSPNAALSDHTLALTFPPFLPLLLPGTTPQTYPTYTQVLASEATWGEPKTNSYQILPFFLIYSRVFYACM